MSFKYQLWLSLEEEKNYLNKWINENYDLDEMYIIIREARPSATSRKCWNILDTKHIINYFHFHYVIVIVAQ